MKYVCLGYIETGKFENMSESERNALVDACLAYDDVLRKNGQFAGGEATATSHQRRHTAIPERQGRGHRRPVRRDQGTDRRDPDPGSE